MAMVENGQGEVLERVRRAAEALKSYFGARRVVLFGSLVDGEGFGEDSDVDLAAEGLEPFDAWDAWWLCEEIVEDRRVDLVPVEWADGETLRAIRQTGVEL
jgi:predicted nucleotidyltransferase